MNKEKDILNYLDLLIPDPKCELNYSKDYEFLLAVMLSAQTKDLRVNKVTKVLFNKYDSLEKLKNANIKDIETITNCKRGDFKNNKSAIECCTDVAKANGWDTKLDITNPIMKEIDELYNPINIASRAEYLNVVENYYLTIKINYKQYMILLISIEEVKY